MNRNLLAATLLLVFLCGDFVAGLPARLPAMRMHQSSMNSGSSGPFVALNRNGMDFQTGNGAYNPNALQYQTGMNWNRYGNQAGNFGGGQNSRWNR